MLMEQVKNEVWRNPNAGYVYVEKLKANGDTDSVAVPPGGKFSISSQDRKMNQDKAFSRAMDLFSNSTLERVTLVDTAEDYEQLIADPNIVGEDELKDYFQLKVKDFREKLAEISNVKILERLKNLSEDDSSNATVHQQKAIASRIEEIDPEYGQLPKLTDYTEGTIIKPTYL